MWQLKNNLFFDEDFSCLNLATTKALGNMREDPVREKFCYENSLDYKSLVTAEQVHGKQVAVVDSISRGKKIPDCDGLITCEAGIPLGIFTADCLPVFFGSLEKPAAGLIHAGWRGLREGIIQEAVGIFKKDFGIRPSELSVLIGPHIQKCCYEVSDELRKIFKTERSEKNLDFSAIAVKILLQEGVNRASVNASCSCHEADKFFSYRRDKTNSRMMSVVMIKRG